MTSADRAAAHKLIIDTDPGIDDAMAIHYACADSRIELVGLTTIFGNVFIHQATRNALFLLEQAGYDADVAEGAEHPIIMTPNPPSHYVHGDEGLGDLSAPDVSEQADSRPAWTYISEMCRQFPGEIVLCPVGPLTNIARLLEHDPDIVSYVRKLVIMGGAVWVPGNVTDYAEANIWNDPHAADMVFAADWDIDLIGLDVTQKIACDAKDFDQIAEASPQIGGFLKQISEFYIRFYHSVLGREVCIMHDPSAVISVTDPELFSYRKAEIEVMTDGDEIGRTRAVEGSGRRQVNVAVDARCDDVRKRFLDICAQADKMKTARG